MLVVCKLLIFTYNNITVCVIYAQADWLPEYLHELAVFAKDKDDDQVDLRSYLLNWLRETRR